MQCFPGAGGLHRRGSCCSLCSQQQTHKSFCRMVVRELFSKPGEWKEESMSYCGKSRAYLEWGCLAATLLLPPDMWSTPSWMKLTGVGVEAFSWEESLIILRENCFIFFFVANLYVTVVFQLERYIWFYQTAPSQDHKDGMEGPGYPLRLIPTFDHYHLLCLGCSVSGSTT